jgi:predicted nucleotidyltransferase component of viral defense system
MEIPDDFSRLAAIIPEGVISLFSAAQYHDLTTVIPQAIEITLSSNMRTPVLPENLHVKIYKSKIPLYAVGIETATIENATLKIYDRERTVCDFFRMRQKIGKDTAMEVLRNYISGISGKKKSAKNLRIRKGAQNRERHSPLSGGDGLTNTESVKSRLKKIADESGKDFNYLLMHYMIERILYRLSVSPYADNFVLKGGMLLYAVLENKARTTRDIDFLARKIQNSPEELIRIFIEIAAIQFDDAVRFDTGALSAERIKEDAEYEGIRIKITGFLDRSRHVLQFDIGFGDVVVPTPIPMTWPSLLDMEAAKLTAYTLESVIAEKFQAMVYLAEANSRMKDFYDVYELCISHDFNGAILFKAIAETFEHRKTDTPSVPVIFSEHFPKIPDKKAQWKGLQQRIGLAEKIEFADAIETIRGYFWLRFMRLYAINGSSFLANHKPVIKGTDHGIWRRIKLIPFTTML